MKSTVFIPKKIKVGYQNRSDTYTKMLAYVVYYDERNKLRKEASFESWRDKSIDVNDFDNEPTDGFVLNKKVGGCKSDWNFRQAYCRVYDPRGFEFEIAVPNLLYILENTSSIKGKGLEGKLVYGWDGKDLVLIPVEAPEYKDLLQHAENLKGKVSAKELVPGCVYTSRKNERLMYLGRFMEHPLWERKSSGKHFFRNLLHTSGFNTYSGIGHLTSKESDVPDKSFPEVMEQLEHSQIYSPIDESLNEYVPLTIEEAETYFTDVSTGTGKRVWFENKGQRIESVLRDFRVFKTARNYYPDFKLEDLKHVCPDGHVRYIRYLESSLTKGTLKELFDTYQFTVLKQHLKNGKEKWT